MVGLTADLYCTVAFLYLPQIPHFRILSLVLTDTVYGRENAGGALTGDTCLVATGVYPCMPS